MCGIKFRDNRNDFLKKCLESVCMCTFVLFNIFKEGKKKKVFSCFSFEDFGGKQNLPPSFIFHSE